MRKLNPRESQLSNLVLKHRDNFLIESQGHAQKKLLVSGFRELNQDCLVPELIALGEESQFIPFPFKPGIRLKPFASITTE